MDPRRPRISRQRMLGSAPRWVAIKKAQEGENKIALQMQVEERRKVCKFGRLLSSHLTKKEKYFIQVCRGLGEGV